MNWRLLGNSLAVSALTTLLACGFGFCAAVCLSALASRARKVAFVASVVALMLPPFLATNCWIHLLGATGVWRRWLPLSIYSLAGVVWILALIYWPITLLVVLGAWQKLERALFEADPVLRGVSLIRWLLLPAARPALAQAALITFVLALNHFAVPAILQVKVFPAEIWLRLSTELNYGAAWAMSAPLILVSAIALVLLRSRGKQISWPAQQSAAPRHSVRIQLGAVFWICAATTLIIIFFSVLPLLQIALDAKTWRELPTVFSATSQTVWNSFIHAALAASACLVLAAWSWRWRIGWCAWLLFLAPGVLIGTIMIFLFNRPLLDAIYHSMAVVIIAFVCRFAALNWQGARAAMQRVDRHVLDALRLETGSHWCTFWTGYWPQTAATFSAVWYATYLLCLWEVETLIMIYPPGGETLALRVFNLLHYGHIAQVNALCLLLLALAVLPLLAWAVVGGIISRDLKTLTKTIALVPFLLTAVALADDSADFRSRADEYLTELTQEEKFSGSVLVATNGNIVFSKAYGLANREHGIANTTNTIFRLASVTKQFTAMCILILQEEHKLNVTNHIEQYVKACPAAWSNITIHHLLTHTAGIPDYTQFPDHFRRERLPTTVAATVKLVKDKPLDFEPGTKMQYSNSGYVLLGYIIEKLSGKSYEQFLSEKIFQPLGMNHSGYDHPETILKGRAAGYGLTLFPEPFGTNIVNCIPFAMDLPHAAGALYSTVGDMLIWDQALYSGRIVAAKSLEAMFTDYKDRGYCYGWLRGRVGESDRVGYGHGGRISGFVTHVNRFSKERVYVVVLCNIDWMNPSDVANKLSLLLLDKAQ